MTDLQKKLLDILKWFDAFCEENNLRYYALGGTMLGAIRHKGFIPWDDDIDVGMPRSDYKRLQELLKESDGRYILETPYSTNDDYCYPISKIYDTTTTLIEKKRKVVKRGVFIDVFPLDGLGNTKEECEFNYKPINKKYDWLLLNVAAIRKGRKPLKNLAVFLTRMIPEKLLNPKKILLDLDALCAKYDYDKSVYCGNLLGAWRFKEVMPVAVMGKPNKYTFEDIQIYGAEDYNTYLTTLYGDWSQLPPKSKQVTHHDFLLLDLDKSYLE